MPEYNGAHKKTVGEILKEARESKGIAILTVHETTKIPMDVLKAIEEGYSVRTLSSFYLKGFVKMYAEYLNVDVAKVLGQPFPVLQKAEQPSKPKITQLKEKTYAVSEDDFDFNKIISKERQRQIVKGIGILIALFLCVRIIGCFIPKKGEKKVAEKPKQIQPVSPREVAKKKLIVPAAAPVKTKSPSVVKTAQPAAAKTSSAPAAAPGAQKDVPEKVRLTIKTLKGGWLQVKVDGTVVMESTLSSGTVESWEANREIVISGRTIHNLEFELNGKMLGTLGRQDRNARRVVITKKGLAVKR